MDYWSECFQLLAKNTRTKSRLSFGICQNSMVAQLARTLFWTGFSSDRYWPKTVAQVLS